MLLATFGPTTTWAGKSISYDNGRFSLEGHGPISAADVLGYDNQGHLIWADDGLRELVQQTLPPSAPPVPPPVVTLPPTVEVREKVPPTPVTPPSPSATPDPPPVVTLPPVIPIYEPEPFREPVPPITGPKPGSFVDPVVELEPMPPTEVAALFEHRTELAERIIRTSGMKAIPHLKMRYVNLNVSVRTMAQIHPQVDGVGLVLCRRGDHLPDVSFREIPVASLGGRHGPNIRWLDGNGPPYDSKGPAVAFLIPDGIDDLGDDAPGWQDIVRLLRYSKTL